MKARRGRPKKNTQAEGSKVAFSESNVVIPSSSSTAHASQTALPINVSEFDLAIEALPRKVRASTAMVYRMPLEHWKVFFKT